MKRTVETSEWMAGRHCKFCKSLNAMEDCAEEVCPDCGHINSLVKTVVAVRRFIKQPYWWHAFWRTKNRIESEYIEAFYAKERRERLEKTNP